MIIKPLNQIVQELKEKPKEINQEGIIYGDEFEEWLKRRKDFTLESDTKNKVWNEIIIFQFCKTDRLKDSICNLLDYLKANYKFPIK